MAAAKEDTPVDPALSESPASSTSPDDVVYVKNELGAVHSVSREHFENVLHETSANGRSYILHGWSEISEAEAKDAHPQLFGAVDPQITFNSKEIEDLQKRQAFEDEQVKLNAEAE